MFYIMYLTNLCQRRRWLEPDFEVHQTRNGWNCRVRVNGREYTCDSAYQTKEMARDKAAEAAYMICRNFSVNDGMYPGQKQGQAGVTQGLPVAIGTGRLAAHQRYNTGEYASTYVETSSGGSSPRTSESDLETGSRRSSSSSSTNVCYCRNEYGCRQQPCGYCRRVREQPTVWY
ncbi:hypothetical protein EJ06DRAFT_413324 [Trichodelitschia bisporula]|uniref:DRBM domain-containing protein n=1 Tax=Trichodelitschia bisporula TaxID=703511 RepID=A0A6G1HXY7_9PEZI|nr:hypothetical protein EJ06DRAFT_413324 [Trichodelitschia bisporula]